MSFYLTLFAHDDPGAVADALGVALDAAGYIPYDPFPGGKGPARIWAEKVTAFVAPPDDSTVRVIGPLPEAIITQAAADLNVPALHLWLDGEGRGHRVYGDLAAWLRPGKSAEDVARASDGPLEGLPLAPVEVEEPGALPDEVRALASKRRVNMDRAQKMMDNWAGTLFGKLGQGSATQDEARRALQGESLWETPQGRRLRALAACLALPAAWSHPTLDRVRAAYSVARRKQQGAPLLQSDERALAALPTAADYRPVYFGIPA